jgi:hypothetical protein
VPTILDRLLGREPPQKAVVTGTGGEGPGVLAWQQDVPLWAASKNPRRLMKQAQELYHRDLVVRALERRVSTAAANLPWHLEDEDKDEITEESDEQARQVLDWLERPQQSLPLNRRQTGASTRRDLWFITSRHAGLCGSAFWFLDQQTRVTGSALATLYINPARMFPVQDEQGFLRGWKLDADEDGNGGVPLELEEVRHFVFEPPDMGHYGIGLVESGGTTAYLSESIERHATQVIRGGARMAGLMAPKVGTTVSDDQWEATKRDWRNLMGSDESAKRLHILRAPVDFTRTAATMQELAVEALYKMSREDKMALWGVPASQVPFPTAAGLNSGETKGYDEAVFYQGAVHDRVNVLKDVLQGQILDPIAEAGGPKLTLVVEEPEFDDETPLFERAQKARDLPLTANERRAQVGLDPLPDVDTAGEPLGTAIWLPVGLSMVAAGPDEAGNLIALPEPEPPPAVLPPPVEEELPPEVGKATLGGLRKRVDTRFVRALQKDVAEALRAQAQAVAKRIRSRGAAVRKSKGAWWDEAVENARLRKAIERHNLAVATLVTEEVPKLIPHKAEPFEETVLDFIRTRTGERIAGINQTTRDAIAALIAEGFEQGLGPEEVADSIEAATAFNEARAELVARTESMFAYNEAALSSYREFGVTEVEALDGDQDEECAERNGQTFSVDEAFGIADHPNGTLDWAPVIKAEPIVPIEVGDADMITGIKAAIRSLAEPPVVNIEPPIVHVEPTKTPEVHIHTDSFVEAIAELKAMLEKPRNVEVVRDDKGRITGTRQV